MAELGVLQFIVRERRDFVSGTSVRILLSSHHSLVLGLGRVTDNFLRRNALTNNVVSMFINHNIGCSCEINKKKLIPTSSTISIYAILDMKLKISQ